MARRLIGYGYTNSNGVATLDYDASGTSISPSGYTGVGAGIINIQAELHDDSTVVSGTFNVWDCLAYDKGIQGDSDTRNLFTSMSQFTRGSDGTTGTITSPVGTTRTQVNGGVAIEFELLEVNNCCRIQITRAETGKTSNYDAYKFQSTGTARLEVTPTQNVFKLNGEVVQTFTNRTQADYIFYIIEDTAQYSFKYKDLRIYPI